MDRNAKRLREHNPRWLRPSDRYGWFAVVRNTLPFFMLLALAPVLATRSLPAAWLLAPFIGLFAYKMTIVMHDCAHATLFDSSRLNRWMGRTLGAMTGIDFRSYSILHWQHHRIYGRPQDPQGFHYLGVKAMTGADFIWHLCKPLLGFNLRYTLSESILNPRNLRRILRTREAVLVVAMQLLVLAIVTRGATYASLVFLPFASAATFGLFLSQLRGIAEHGVLGDVAPVGFVRSHAPHLLERIFLYDLHFNYHAAHHAWPHYPSCHLPDIHQQCFAENATPDASMIATVATIAARPAHG